MKTWKATLIGASVIAANAAFANVSVTGMKNSVTPVRPLSLSRDLSQIAYRSKRPAPIRFPSPLSARTGEIQLPGAFNPSEPRDSKGNLISADRIIPCSPAASWQCGNPEITAWSGPGTSALRLALGPDVDVATFDRARKEMNELLETTYGLPPETKRVDGLSVEDFEPFAGGAD